MHAFIRILGGLAVTVEYDIDPADTSVGIMAESLAGWEIVAIGGKPCKPSPEWLERRIEAVPGERDRIEQKIWEAYGEYLRDAANERAERYINDREY